jgi:serine protease Do
MMRPLRSVVASMLAISACAASYSVVSSARADADIDAKAKAAAQSLVIVDFTLRNENSSREDSGQGILLNKDGVILIANSLISENLPKEWITEIKVRLPNKNFEAQPAKFLGRTRNRLFAYLKTEQPVEATPFDVGALSEAKLGQQVFSVSVSGRAGGYATFVGRSDIRVLLDLNHQLIGTASFGLTRGTSPVFDINTGNFVGITLPSPGDSMVLREGGAARRVELVDEEQSSVFLPNSEIGNALKDIPKEPFDQRRPWLAVDELTGLQEDVRELRKISQPSGVMVGTVIPNEDADKAGLKARDIILKVDDKEFSKNPVPEMMVMHFSRAMDNKKPGDTVKLTVLRDGKTVDVPVVLSELPKSSGEMPHVFSPRIGLVTRDLVFGDLYARRLPQDTKGVMVALVKTGSPASLGSTPIRGNLIITKVDDQPVENQKQFLEVMKKYEDKADVKEMVFVVIQTNGETQVCRVDMTK